MKKEWSVKKVLVFWIAFFAIIWGIFKVIDLVGVTDVAIMVILGAVMLLFGISLFIFLFIDTPKEIMKDIKENRKVRDAKWAAYKILDEFGTVHLRERIDHYRLERLKERKEIEEITEVLSKKHSDSEARHLLNDLYELGQELDQVSDKDEEGETE